MAANQDPAIQQGIAPEQGPDLALLKENNPVTRLQRILEDRDDASADRRAALLEDPRTRTLLETGQLTTAAALAADSATGISEPPEVRPPKHRHHDRRGGRSYSEGTESELDTNWTEAAPEISADEKATVRGKMRDFIEQKRLENAAHYYQENVKAGDTAGALARLRAKGFIPDPRTQGQTVIRIEDANQILEGK